MFSGIVEQIGRIIRLSPRSAHTRLELDAGSLLENSLPGASVAINGACLTLTETRAGLAAFDVVPETLRLTNLGALRSGDLVNVERSLRVGDRIDGHFVQGHIDGLGRIVSNGADSGGWSLSIAAPRELTPFLVRKGSITIDGVSLTIASVSGDTFSVALIPTTLERTTLGQRRAGDAVNLETDILARLIVSRLDAHIRGGAPAAPEAPTGITFERLRAAGLAT